MNKNVQKNLEWARGKLAASESALLDAEVILAHTLGMERVGLYLNRERILTDEETKRFEDLVARRARREPVAYITGSKEFWSINLAITPDVLIPRPETEGIVEQALAIYDGARIDVLDLCTGSGCVAAALATELPDSTITVTDISPAAVEIARKNLAFAGDRIVFFTGDLFDALGRPKKFDLITANPPYVADTDALSDDIRLYEPRLALLAESDGLAISTRIIQDAPKYLKAGGALIMEIGIGQADALWEIAAETGKYESLKVFEDYSGIERIFVAKSHG